MLLSSDAVCCRRKPSDEELTPSRRPPSCLPHALLLELRRKCCGGEQLAECCNVPSVSLLSRGAAPWVQLMHGINFFYGGRVALLETDPMAAGAGHAARKHARLLWFVAGIVSVDRVNTCCGILLSYRHDFTPMFSAHLEVLYLISEPLA